MTASVSNPEAKPVVLIADKLAQSTVDALGDSVEVRWVDGPNREELLAAVPEAPIAEAAGRTARVAVGALIVLRTREGVRGRARHVRRHAR